MANQVKKRNPHACSPIMRKGGVHQKSNSAKRAKDKRQLKEQTRAQSRDWSSFLFLFILKSTYLP